MGRRLKDSWLILVLIFAALLLPGLLNNGLPALGRQIYDTLLALPAVIIALSFHEYAHA